MTGLETLDRNAPETDAENAGRPTVCRRSTARVLATSGFILLTVWGLRYAAQAGDAIHAAGNEDRAWTHLLDPKFLAATCPQALAVLLAVVVGFCLALRWKRLRSLERLILESLREPAEGPSRCGRSWTWIALGLATVATALSVVEWIEPCYFVQDDNFAHTLPAILQGCRSIFRGEFPDFDPCQLMGMPSAGKGLNAPLPAHRRFLRDRPVGARKRVLHARSLRGDAPSGGLPGIVCGGPDGRACGRPWPTCWESPSCSPAISSRGPLVEPRVDACVSGCRCCFAAWRAGSRGGPTGDGSWPPEWRSAGSTT